MRLFPSSLRCICTVESSRRDKLRRFSTELFQSDQSPQFRGLTRPGHQGFTLCCTTSQVFHGADGHQRLAHSGSAVAKPSEQGRRKSNGINAAPSYHAESFVAM